MKLLSSIRVRSVSVLCIACCFAASWVGAQERASTFSSKAIDQRTVICLDITLGDGTEIEACTIRGELIRISTPSETLGLSPSILEDKEKEVAIGVYRITEHPLKDGSGTGESIAWLETFEISEEFAHTSQGLTVELASIQNRLSQ